MKLRKTYHYNRYLSDGTKVLSYDASGNGYMYFGTARFTLDNNVPTFESIPFSGGRIVKTSNGYEPQYYLTDHLGSVRRVLDADLNLVEQNDYYPFGKRIDDPEKLTADNIYRYNGKESLEIFGIPYSDYGARLFDSNIGRWLQTDLLAQDYPNISPYAFCANNPMNIIDPNGMDNYYINSNGNIRIEYTDDSFNQYTYVTTDTQGNEISNYIGQFDKNSAGLIQMSNFTFDNGNISFSYKVKSGQEQNSYINGDAMASFLGVMASTGFQDVTIVGVSRSNGESPAPSISHKDGKNMDLRYLRTDGSGIPVLLNDQNFDISRQNLMNESLYLFGWKSLLSEKFSPAGTSDVLLLNKTTHYNKARHNNHLHTQGFNPYIYVDGGILKPITIYNK